MAPSIAFDAPRLVTINSGNIPRIISVEKSVKKLTVPNATTLRIPGGLSLFELSFDKLCHLLNYYYSEYEEQT